jgi:hypothetical protein
LSSAGLAQQVHRLGYHGGEVVGSVRQGGVIGAPLLVGDPGRSSTQLGDQLLPELTRLRIRRQCHGAAGQPVEVDVGAGEGHGRVQRDRSCSGCSHGRQYVDAVPAADMHDDLPVAYDAGCRELGGHRCQGVVGHGDEHDVGIAGHGDGVGPPYTRQQGLDAGARRG